MISPLSAVWGLSGEEEKLKELVGGELLSQMHDRDPMFHSALPVWKGDVKPGDVVYCPAGAYHAVQTLEDSITIVNNFIDAGKLLPFSEINYAMLRKDAEQSDLANWLQNSSMRTSVFDEKGVVTDANSTARGFPKWSDLE